jgi:hypothetical protein
LDHNIPLRTDIETLNEPSISVNEQAILLVTFAETIQLLSVQLIPPSFPFDGKWIIQQDSFNLPFDGANWDLPDLQHAKETSNIEELLMDPEDFNAVPEQVQFGCDQWTDDDDPTIIQWGEFYVRDEAFYTSSFNQSGGFYILPEEIC